MIFLRCTISNMWYYLYSVYVQYSFMWSLWSSTHLSSLSFETHFIDRDRSIKFRELISFPKHACSTYFHSLIHSLSCVHMKHITVYWFFLMVVADKNLSNLHHLTWLKKITWRTSYNCCCYMPHKRKLKTKIQFYFGYDKVFAPNQKFFAIHRNSSSWTFSLRHSIRKLLVCYHWLSDEAWHSQILYVVMNHQIAGSLSSFYHLCWNNCDFNDALYFV